MNTQAMLDIEHLTEQSRLTKLIAWLKDQGVNFTPGTALAGDPIEWVDIVHDGRQEQAMIASTATPAGGFSYRIWFQSDPLKEKRFGKQRKILCFFYNNTPHNPPALNH